MEDDGDAKQTAKKSLQSIIELVGGRPFHSSLVPFFDTIFISHILHKSIV